MFTSTNYGYWEFWDTNADLNFYGQQKVTFDGINRYIIVNEGVTDIDIEIDVYSNWKEWITVRDNSKFVPAIRTTGGDPIPGTGDFTGDTYFLINNWRLVYDPRETAVTGVLFSDDFNTAYYLKDSLSPLYPARVSSIVNKIGINIPSSSDNAQAVWDYTTRTLTSVAPPTAFEIRQELDANSTRLADIDSNLQTVLNTTSPQDIWNYLLSNTFESGSAGEKLKQVLTTGNFLALK